MAGNFSPPNPTQPLSVGNVVSVAVRLYRSHLQTYLQLALFAHLWIILPVYGWAKYAAICGLISRLAFGELVNQPETVQMARSHTEPRLWSFLRVAFQVALYLILLYVALAFAGGMVAGLLGVLIGIILGSASILITTTMTIILLTVIVLLGISWFYARWLIAEVPLAVEENINGGESVDRSWDLTKTSAFRIQGVVVVAFLVTLPIVLLFNYAPSLFLLRLEPGTTVYNIVYLISWIVSLVGGIFVMPFWQAIKSVVYYDLRSRREGLGLKLRDTEI